MAVFFADTAYKYIECGPKCWICCRCFLRCILSSSFLKALFLTYFDTNANSESQPLLPSASSYQLSVLMSVSFMSRVQTCLKHSAGRSAGRHAVASSPYMTSFGRRPSFIRRTCPGRLSRRWQRRCTYSESRPAPTPRRWSLCLTI